MSKVIFEQKKVTCKQTPVTKGLTSLFFEQTKINFYKKSIILTIDSCNTEASKNKINFMTGDTNLGITLTGVI